MSIAITRSYYTTGPMSLHHLVLWVYHLVLSRSYDYSYHPVVWVFITRSYMSISPSHMSISHGRMSLYHLVLWVYHPVVWVYITQSYEFISPGPMTIAITRSYEFISLGPMSISPGPMSISPGPMSLYHPVLWVYITWFCKLVSPGQYIDNT